MSRLNLFPVLILSFLLPGIATTDEESGSKPSELEQSLRKRVTGFYMAVRSSRWNEAEQFVAASGKEMFKENRPAKILSFEIVSLKLEGDRNSALVQVSNEMIFRTVGRVAVPATTRWVHEEGDWYLDTVNPPPTLAEKFQEYYVDKKIMRAGKSKGAATQPAVKVEKETVNFGVVAQGKVLDLRFPVSNLSSSEIRIEKLYLQEQFMKDVTQRRTLKPGETGEVVVQLDTSLLYREVDQTIFVELQPVKEMLQLRVIGKVFTAKDLEDYTPPN